MLDDAVDAYFAAAEHITQCRGHAFNIGGGIANSSSLLELFAQLESQAGVRLVYERLPWRHSDQRFFVADTRKAQRLLGWRPRVDKAAGIARMLDWCAALAGRSDGAK